MIEAIAKLDPATQAAFALAIVICLFVGIVACHIEAARKYERGQF